MPFPWAAAISGASSLAGGLFSASGQRDANRANLKIAADNRKFQERMSSTAHQRETVDLERAGLNRILGYTGKGASTPPGATAVMQNTKGAGIDAAAKTMNAALSAAQLRLTNATTRAKQGEAVIGETKGKLYNWIIEKFMSGKDDVMDASGGTAKTFPLPNSPEIAPPQKIDPPTTSGTAKMTAHGPGWYDARSYNERGLNAVITYWDSAKNPTREGAKRVYDKASQRKN